ncbi:MFS transporter [Nonomuraea sp. MCN248]|uniref:MFS transporter n=1 Tax=Nonomuraea corallina TaxID=2989783 RepID=A0ABT4SK14_9ACTN|nr:MFS transporter [Nonomuraea corallina]MDA0637568.1 MFS transporter [Nonomuraea corallina]
MARLGRSFGFLLSSTALSNLADGVLKVGAPLMAVSFTRSPALVALAGAAASLPWLLLALPAGALVDRLDRRRIMVVANAARVAVLAAATALAALGLMNLWLLLAAVVLACASEVFADTSAQAVLPMTVPDAGLTRANGRVVGAQILGNDFAGAPLAGLLVTALPAAVLGAPGILYGAAGLLLLGMRGRFRPSREAPRPVAREIAESLRYLWSHPFLRTLALVAGVLNTAGAAYFGVLVLWVVGEGSAMGLTPSGYGLMLTVFAVGALAGSMVAGRAGRLAGDAPAFVALWAVVALLHLVPVLLPVPWLLYATAAGWGVAGAAANVLVITSRQRIIPGELLGRVNAAYRLIGMGGMPLGAALGGLAGEAAGLPAVFLGSAAVQLLAVYWIGRVVFSPNSRRVTSGVTIPDISGSR